MRECDKPEQGVETSHQSRSPESETGAEIDVSRMESASPTLLTGLIEHIPFGVLVMSAPSGQLLAKNAEAERIFGEPLSNVASASAYLDKRLSTKRGRPRANIIRETLTTGRQATDLPVQFHRADGTVVDLILASAPIVDPGGALEASVLFCREIRPGSELDKSAPVWISDDLLSSLSTERGSRLRETFLTTAAHELRTPLTTISGFSQLLERQLGWPELDRERLLKLTGELRQQVERMVNLADDLMKAMALQDDRVTVRQQPCELVAIVRASVDRARLLERFSDQHTLRMEAPERVTALCDPEHVDQIVTNLVSNAVKYSPDGGMVRVAVAPAGDHVELRVSDHGIGIAPEDQVRLWQPFIRFGPMRRIVDGTGLGLYIVRHLVERNDGTISVESESGSGSTFIVRLPAWPVRSQTKRVQ